MLFFGSDSNGRQRCSIEGDTVTMGSEKFTTLAFAKLVQEHPERFTPNVLARPVVQDAVLPTVISVLGSAEIAYQAQLRELYELCGVPMPYLVLRNGATLLDARTERLLAKDGHPLSWFMRSSEDVERATADLLTSDVLPNTEERNATLETLLAPYLTAAQSIDQTLIATVRAQGAGITATLEALEGKLRAAAKRAGAQTQLGNSEPRSAQLSVFHDRLHSYGMPAPVAAAPTSAPPHQHSGCERRRPCCRRRRRRAR